MWQRSVTHEVSKGLDSYLVEEYKVQARFFSVTLPLRDLRKVKITPTITPKKINFVNKLKPGLSVDGVTSAAAFSGCFSDCFVSPAVTSRLSLGSAGSAFPMSSLWGKTDTSAIPDLIDGTEKDEMKKVIYSSARVPSSGISSSPDFAILTVLEGLSPPPLGTFSTFSTIS